MCLQFVPWKTRLENSPSKNSPDGAIPLSQEQRGQARTELAQLEAEAHKLECQGVDNVYTGDLDSGKAEAKDLKKALLARLETVLERIEETFRRLKMPSTADVNGCIFSTSPRWGQTPQDPGPGPGSYRIELESRPKLGKLAPRDEKKEDAPPGAE
eukprot:s2547_g1.t1